MAETDRDALVAMYRATGGQGVNVNDQGRVVKLQLNWNNLAGTVVS
ncbi:unnamed protein product [Ectocarpus sp. CCAP 1310/34]|nr:unnamed protein product [Ectocarpus sp. CCAP 1310/34]